MPCGTKRKPKTKPPVKTRTLDSFRKPSARLSKSTEDRLKASYTKRKTAKRSAKKKGGGWVDVDTGNVRFDTGWVQVEVLPLLTSKPQTIHEIGSKALAVASTKVGHHVQDPGVAERLPKCLWYLVKRGDAEVSKTKGGFTKYSTISKARVDKILRRYARAYDLLYSTRDLSEIGIPDSKYRKLVDAGRIAIDVNPGVYKAFVRANGDAATSDRELAAYAWAWNDTEIPRPSQVRRQSRCR